MDRSKWESMLTYFQAFARGYLVRNEVRRAREDFEVIVKEIDGGLSHLQWRDTVISIPHFTDTHGPFPRPSSSTKEPGLNVSSPSAGAATCLSNERVRDQHILLQRIEAERDNSQAKDHDHPSRVCFSSSHVGGDGEEERQRDVSGGLMESTGDSTSVWSSLDMDMNYGHSHKGSQQFCLAQEVPRTPETLRLHRNTLTMELVWLQQAIDSRKKYLALKDRLSIS
ncbi:IQ domain-containing protein C [Anabas testudineus]|uniref:IQ domain-containing protein C n=1 Tax=Anabas testudineus TaxID=64144 RepID=UPI000E45C151|nr:IQ domain-containing protein C [Anabas testudineus]